MERKEFDMELAADEAAIAAAYASTIDKENKYDSEKDGAEINAEPRCADHNHHDGR